MDVCDESIWNLIDSVLTIKPKSPSCSHRRKDTAGTMIFWCSLLSTAQPHGLDSLMK